MAIQDSILASTKWPASGHEEYANDAKHFAWHTNAEFVYAINTYPNGVTLSIHHRTIVVGACNSTSRPNSPPANGARSPSSEAGHEGEKSTGMPPENESLNSLLPEQFSLRVRDTRDYMLPAGRYYLYKESFRQSLERHLAQLYKLGKLPSAVFYFGTVTDPFHSFHKKFEVTMACLDLFEHYKPGMLVVQTRSPMVIAALPTLRLLSPKAVVTIPIESPIEAAVARYTPGQPRISERLVAIDGMRRQGVKVNVAASPILPYGDFVRDAFSFAELLADSGDYVTLSSLAFGDERSENQLKNLPIAQKLVTDHCLQWLRPQSYLKVLEAVQQIAPEKLQIGSMVQLGNPQLSLFAA